MKQARRFGILILAAALFVGAAPPGAEQTHGQHLTDPALTQPQRIPLISPRVRELMEGRPEARLKVWVYLTDKGILDERECQTRLDAARAAFPKRTLHRRAKVRAEDDLVDFRDISVKSEYIAAIEATGAKHRAISRWLNAVSIEATPDQIRAISRLPFVRAINPLVSYRRTFREEVRPAPPRAVTPLEQPGRAFSWDYGLSDFQLEQINVLPLHMLGYSGAGVIVCMLDTGFNRHHEALTGIDLIAEHDFINDDDITENEPGDPPGQDYHGTATLSVLGGFSDGNLIGPAYGASFILAKTEDTSGEYPQEEDWWVEGIEWADSLGADVVSSSLGYIDWYTYPDMNGDSAVTTQAADWAAYNGIVVCNCMGNEGPASGTMLAPADADSIIAVGAVDRSNIIATFSSRGPTYDGRTKPEVCALGVDTYLVDPATTTAYGYGSGTSFSTPLIGGSAGLLLEIHPEWTPMQVREALLSTASQSSSPDNDYGWGIADVFAASGLSIPILTLEHYYLDDDSSGTSAGNGDGVAQPGESIELPVSVRNSGTAVGHEVRGVISTADPYVTITDSVELFGDIPEEGIATTFDDFDFTVSLGHPVGQTIDFTLVVADERGTQFVYTLEVRVPRTSNWVKSPLNPVFSPGDSTEWDSFVVGGTMLEDEGVFKMWYAGVGGDTMASVYQIGLATSTDGGLTWEREPSNPVLSPSASGWDNVLVWRPFVIRDGDTLKMWFIGSDGLATAGVGYATSTDGGITWEKYGGNPVLLGQYYSWDWFIIYGLFLSKSGPDDYRMWYSAFGYPDFLYRIGLATSQDGVNWTRHGAPILSESGDPGRFDQLSVWDPFVVWEGDRYRMWYGGIVEEDGRYRVGSATSPDGIIWTRQTGPGDYGCELDVGGPGRWDQTIIISPQIFVEGESYRMFFSGDSGVGFATRPIVSVERDAGDEELEQIVELALGQNRPNPVRDETEIEFALPKRGPVRLAVYNILGQRVAYLMDEVRQAGVHRVRWVGTDAHGSRVASGIYFCRLEADGRVLTRRMIVLR